VTDDTVLEEHNEDPRLVQMRLIGDGGNSMSFFKYKFLNYVCRILCFSGGVHHAR